MIRAPGDASVVRVGVIAGRKVGNAVKRNYVKRRIRHAMRELELLPGFDYVVVASPRVADAGFGELREWLQEGSRT